MELRIRAEHETEEFLKDLASYDPYDLAATLKYFYKFVDEDISFQILSACVDHPHPVVKQMVMGGFKQFSLRSIHTQKMYDLCIERVVTEEDAYIIEEMQEVIAQCYIKGVLMQKSDSGLDTVIYTFEEESQEVVLTKSYVEIGKEIVEWIVKEECFWAESFMQSDRPQESIQDVIADIIDSSLEVREIEGK